MDKTFTIGAIEEMMRSDPENPPFEILPNGDVRLVGERPNKSLTMPLTMRADLGDHY